MAKDAFEKYGNKTKPEEKNETKPNNEAVKEEAAKEETKTVAPAVDVAAQVQAFHKQQMEKELKGETHGNYTLVVSHDTMERLDTLAEHFPRGFKSELINEAIAAYVNAYEGVELPPKRKKRGKR
ncbi:hypothetical protein [Alkalicoccobacillus gibsonii]|uniref:hypothetical protein n=1 Tax=Alkalicoccobacillus gibsonii TaxID=79881 RepID=UPI0035114BCB